MQEQKTSPAYYGLLLMILVTFMATVGVFQIKVDYISGNSMSQFFPYEFLMALVCIGYWYIFLRIDCPLNLGFGFSKTPISVSLFLTLALALVILSLILSRSIVFKEILPILGTTFFICITEEFTFRVAGSQAFHNNGLSQIKAALLSSLLFSAFHLVHLFAGADLELMPYQLLNAFIMGVVLTYIYISSKSILVPIAFHTVWDFMIFLNKSNQIKIQSILTLLSLTIVIILFLWAILNLYKKPKS